MKAIIIGATSGIGWELAKIMSQKGYDIGITGRRTEKLQALQQALQGKVHLQTMDITQFEEAREGFRSLVERMGGVDIVVVNAGYGVISTKWDNELQMINTNATGFAAITNAAFYYFSQLGHGQIVGISSLAAVRGGSHIPAYNATKAFISSYMEGLRIKAIKKKLNITITDIRPGFVETPMTEQNPAMFWVASAEKAAQQIFTAIQRKSKVAYITKRWVLIAWLIKLLPDFLYKKIG